MIELLGSKCRCRRVLVFLHGLIDTSLIVELVELVGKDGSQSVRRRRWRCGVWSAFLMERKPREALTKKSVYPSSPAGTSEISHSFRTKLYLIIFYPKRTMQDSIKR